MNAATLVNHVGRLFFDHILPRKCINREVTSVTKSKQKEKLCICDVDRNCLQEIVQNCDIIYVFARKNLLGYFQKGRFQKFENQENRRQARSYDIDYYQIDYTEKFPVEESSDESSGGSYYYLITLSFAAVSFYFGAAAASNSGNPLQWSFNPSWVGGSLGASLGALTPAGISASFSFLTGTMAMPGVVAGIVIITFSVGYGYLCAASTGNDWNYRNWNMSSPVMQNALFGGTMFGTAFWAGIGSIETSFLGVSGAGRVIFVLVVFSWTVGTAFYATAVSRGNVRFWEWDWRHPEVVWKTAYGGTFGLGMAIPIFSLGILVPQYMEEMREANKSAQISGDQYIWSNKNETKNPNATSAQIYAIVESIFIQGALFEATEVHPLLNYLPSSASTPLPLLDGFVNTVYNHFEDLLSTPPTKQNITHDLAFPKTNNPSKLFLLPNCYHSAQPDQPHLITCTGQNFQYTIHPKSSRQMPLQEDRYTYCTPIEYGGKPSVVCDGESSTLIFTPKLGTPFLDHVDGWLMLALVAPAIVQNVRSLLGLCCRMFSQELQKERPPDAQDVKLISERFERLRRKVEIAQLENSGALEWTTNILEDLQDDICNYSNNEESHDLSDLLDRISAVEDELLETMSSTLSDVKLDEFVTPVKAFIKNNNIRFDFNMSGFETTDSPIVRQRLKLA